MNSEAQNSSLSGQQADQVKDQLMIRSGRDSWWGREVLGFAASFDNDLH